MSSYRIIWIFLICTSFNLQSNENGSSENSQAYTGPIIDMHMHAENDNTLPPNKLALCPPLSNLVPHFDPRQEFSAAWDSVLKNPRCDTPIYSSTSFEDYSSRILDQLNKFNVTPVVTGSQSVLEEWTSKFGDKIIPSIEFNLERDDITADSLKSLINKKE